MFLNSLSRETQFFVLGVGFVSLLLGYFLGVLVQFSTNKTSFGNRYENIRPEISLIQFEQIEGDLLHLDISGPARILWTDKNLIENDGKFSIPLPQIKNANDLQLFDYPFLGNAKTKKFYPAQSYFARCTAPEHRRFFETKDLAILAGFIPSKAVK